MNVLERIWFCHNFCPIAKWLRHWSLTPVFDGSSPSGAVLLFIKERRHKMTNQNHCCGTCCWHQCGEDNEWICTNEYSVNFGCETDYTDNCDDWEQK